MCSQCHFCKIFLKQFFDIGNSAGSIITEALGLFRTFQSISATKSFQARFSHECLDMFKWATNLIEIISNKIQTIPLTTYEIFSIYNLVIPMTILIFISSVILGHDFYPHILLYGISLTLGGGFGFIKVNNKFTIGLIISSVALFFISFIVITQVERCLDFYLLTFNLDEVDDEKVGQKTTVPFMLSTIVTCLFFELLSIQYLLNRQNLALYILIIIGILCFIMAFFDCAYKNCCKCCCKNRIDIRKLAQKASGFFINCLPLLIIPSTEYFVKLMQTDYKNRWNIILSYIVLSLLLPMSMVLITILTKHPNISDKYRTPKNISFNIFYYVELIDIIKQVVYAIFAAYDIVWGCIGVEIFWFVLIIVLRPYQAISDYSLTFGNSLLIFISNGAVLYSEKHNYEIFTFKISLCFVLVACIPAILSIYLFFIFDFEDESEDDSEKDHITYGMGYVASILTPIAWFFYGINLPIIAKYVKPSIY